MVTEQSRTSDIHTYVEQGGLPPSHWQIVLGVLNSRRNNLGEEDRVGYADPIRRIKAYAGGVVDHAYPDINFGSQSYFGYCEWEILSKIAPISSRLPGLLKGRKTKEAELQALENIRQVNEFARRLMIPSFSLRDYLTLVYDPSRKIMSDYSSPLVSWEGDCWHWSQEYNGRFWDSDLEPKGMGLLVQSWLLDEDSASGSSIYTPPQDFARMTVALAEAEPELVRERLRRRIGFVGDSISVYFWQQQTEEDYEAASRMALPLSLREP